MLARPVTEMDSVRISSRKAGGGSSEPSDSAAAAKITADAAKRPQKATKKRKAKRKPGVVYMSRVPPGLDVGIVRSILGRVGPVGRVWLRAESKETVAERRHIGGRRRAGFTDGWVEFSNCADAEAAAEMLNGKPMKGVTRRGKFQNDLWCLRMLPDFSWDDLVDESCGTRRERVLRVKSEVAAARRERLFVEQRSALAKTIAKSEARKKAEGGEEGGLDGGNFAPPPSDDGGMSNELDGRRIVRRYRQKRPLDNAGEGKGNVEHADEETRALRRLERDNGAGSSVVDSDLLSKLFKKRKTGSNE